MAGAAGQQHAEPGEAGSEGPREAEAPDVCAARARCWVLKQLGCTRQVFDDKDTNDDKKLSLEEWLRGGAYF